MNLTAMRFALRRQRLEIALFSLLIVGLIGLAGWMATAIFALNLGDCYIEPMRASAESCQLRSQQLNQISGLMPVVQALAVFLPPVAGLFLGATIISRETESATAMFAWSFSPSRTRWLLNRVLPVVFILVVLALLAGSAVDAVYAASYPYVRLEENLIDFQVRGPLLAARAMLAFSASLLVGAVLGRLLPALLVGLVITAAVVGGSMALTDTLAHRDPVADPGVGSQLTGVLFKTDDGEILTADEAIARLPRPDAELDQFYQYVDSGIPGSRSVGIVSTSVGGSIVATVGLLALSAAVVTRRRPY